jgi:hydrogenase nickel incorporation protein HypA/HybF
MHELALAEAILAIAEENARGRRVARVELEIGRLRQVVPDALAFSFELVAQGTAAEGAELAIEELPVRVACRTCGAATVVEAFPFGCTGCGALDVEVIDGEQLQVTALELETEPMGSGSFGGAGLRPAQSRRAKSLETGGKGAHAGNRPFPPCVKEVDVVGSK